MREFEKCLQLKRDIDEITEKLFTIRSVILSPKTQVITGMPRGNSDGDNAIEKYIIKAERLEQKRNDLIKQHSELWYYIKQNAKGTEEEMFLLQKRFVEGKPWEKCVAEMTGGKWNINKAFRIYRKIKYRLAKINKRSAKTL